MKTLHKLLIAICCIILVIASISVFATENTADIDEPKGGVIAVNTTKSSTFMVTIPQKIILNNEKTCEYIVKVTGDLASEDYVSVVPAESLQLKQTL